MPIQPKPAAVLVTGASSGIGQATALHLADRGFRVFAACRRIEDGAALEKAAKGGEIVPVVIDVADAAAIRQCREVVEQMVGEAGLAGLVNNAGIGASAPIEATDLASARAAFEVNVFGQLAVIQAFLPLLRRGRGRIVNLGSVGAHITIPFGGVLCASKAAFESFSDALRLELRPFGIRVCVIQPGSIHTPAVAKTLGDVDRKIKTWPDALQLRYGRMFRIFTERAAARETRGSPPDVVARAIHRALTSDRPRSRYPTGRDAQILSLLPRLLPDRILDNVRLRMLGLPTRFGEASEPGGP